MCVCVCVCVIPPLSGVGMGERKYPTSRIRLDDSSQDILKCSMKMGLLTNTNSVEERERERRLQNRMQKLVTSPNQP